MKVKIPYKKEISKYLLILFIFYLLFPFYKLYAEDVAGKVSFNFIDVELPVLAKFVSDVTGKNFIFDDSLKGKVTIIAPSPLKLEDAFSLFTSVLELKGYTVVHSTENIYKIIPSSVAKHKGIEVVSNVTPVNDTYIIRIVKLNNISSKEAVRLLRPIVSKDGYISEFSSGNLLLIIDSATNLLKIMKIVKTIDEPSTLEVPELIFLKHASAEEVAAVLNEGIGKEKRIQLQFIRSNVKAIAVKRLNAIVLFGPKNERKAMKKLITMLDVPSPQEQGRINVYFLENADAEEMVNVLNGIVKGMKRIKEKKIRNKFSKQTIGDIIITADKSTNSLIIMASPSDYKSIVEVIKKLDKRRKQVYVEAMIVEASIDRLREIGAKWRFISTKGGEPILISGVGIIDSSALISLINGLMGFSVGGMGNFLDIPVTQINRDGTIITTKLTVPGFAALFSLNEFKGAINVLSTPQILTSDNKEAEIIVGENVPFITKRESDPTRTVSVFSTIERKDVGITLKIKPQITEGDYVRLDIYQEISSVKTESNPDILISVGPTTTKRSTNTSVIVKNNQTVVIGGLMQEVEEETFNKVPLFGDIPILGEAFKYKSIKKKKTNLLVFLTPHIIKDADSLKKITDEKKRNFLFFNNNYVNRQVLIRFKDFVSEQQARKVITEHGAKIIKYLKEMSLYLVELKEGESVKDGIDYFKSLFEVKYAEPHYKITLQ